MNPRILESEGAATNQLRVLCVIPGAAEDTTMSFSRRQATAVGRLGVDVRPFFLKSRSSPLVVAREIRRLQGDIRALAPHVVHAHYGTMTAFVAAIASRKPLVITFHGSDLNPAPGDPWLKSILARELSHFAARRARRIICVSSQLRERIAYLSSRAHTVPCGVNLEQFRPLPKNECRAKLGWNEHEKFILFNARTDPVGKRLDLAEDAFKFARQQIPDLRLHVFRGLTHPDEMPLYYSAADCLLMTSDYEGSPMVVKEALAANLPVVSVEVGDVAERLKGVSPSAVVRRDPAEIGDAIVKLVRMELRSNGRARMQGLSEDDVARTVASIYRLAAGMRSIHEPKRRLAA